MTEKKKIGRPRKVMDAASDGEQAGTGAEINTGDGAASGTRTPSPADAVRARQRRDILIANSMIAGTSFLMRK